jgi:hydrogenase/urease accessory protein HupE
MKYGCGIVFLVLAIVGIIALFIGIIDGQDIPSHIISGIIMHLVLGLFLISRAKADEEEKKDDDEWENS